MPLEQQNNQHHQTSPGPAVNFEKQIESSVMDAIVSSSFLTDSANVAGILQQALEHIRDLLKGERVAGPEVYLSKIQRITEKALTQTDLLTD